MLDLKSEKLEREETLKHTAKRCLNHQDYLGNIFNTKLYNRDSDLLVIYEAAKLFASSATPDYAINSLLRMMSQMLGLNRGRVLLPDNNKLAIRYSYGLTEQEKQRGVYLAGEGITGKVMQSGHLVVIENIDQEPGLIFRAVKRATLPQEVVSYIALPIMDGKKVIGVLACHRIRSRLRAFDEDLLILRTFATFISQIIKINQLLLERDNNCFDITENFDKPIAKSKIIGESTAIKTLIQQAEHVAPTGATVLLSGESGTGKEYFARLIHQLSDRREKPFIAINCAAIPEQLLEAELFGFERGAFTGAVAKKAGKFELANGGTLFLDEIGDLDTALQTKLLRVLESRSIQRVGAVKETTIDVRILAASHKNLMQGVNQGNFRLDLFYRLNVFPLSLPALRDRKEDIAMLARQFLRLANIEYQRQVTLGSGVLACLEAYSWPGNIRQLENVIKRAVLLCRGKIIHGSLMERILASEAQVQLPLSVPTNATLNTNIPEPHSVNELADFQYCDKCTHKDDDKLRRGYNWVDTNEAEQIREALEHARGNKTQAARMLGLSVRQLRYRLTKLAITT